MTYVYVIGVAIAWILVCFVTPRMQAEFLFEARKSARLKTEEDRDSYFRSYSRRLNAFGVAFALMAVLVLILRSAR